EPRLQGMESPIILDALGQIRELSRLALEQDVVARETKHRRAHRRDHDDGPDRDPAGKADARDARAVPVDHEETERTFHPLIGTTTGSGASAGFSFDIRHWPSSTAPASIMTTGASTSPVSRA